MDVDKRQKVTNAVDAATRTVGPLLDPAPVAVLKRLARASDDNMRIVFTAVMQKMEKKHAQVRPRHAVLQ